MCSAQMDIGTRMLIARVNAVGFCPLRKRNVRTQDAGFISRQIGRVARRAPLRWANADRHGSAQSHLGWEARILRPSVAAILIP